MSDSRRQVRVERELQQVVANFLVRGLKIPLKGLVSVSRVESTPEIRTAKVYVSVLGSDEDREYSMDVLNESLRDIQAHVNKQLRMKFVPKISIELDRGLERYLTVEKKLRDLEIERKQRALKANSTDKTANQDTDDSPVED